MSGDYSLWKREEDRRQANSGLTGRGIASCISVLISAGVAYAVYWWLTRRFDLRYVLGFPSEWPPFAVAALVILVAFMAVQLILIVLMGIVWRLRGKDQKVRDKLEEIYENWDQPQ